MVMLLNYQLYGVVSSFSNKFIGFLQICSTIGKSYSLLFLEINSRVSCVLLLVACVYLGKHIGDIPTCRLQHTVNYNHWPRWITWFNFDLNLDKQFHPSLQWRYGECDGVSNHQLHDCSLKRLVRRRSKKASKLRVTGLCEENSPVTGEFPAQRASNAENVSIWWRYHDKLLVGIGYLFPKSNGTAVEDLE